MPDSDDDDVPLAVKAAWAMAKARTCQERVGLSADDTVPSACGGALQQLHEEIIINIYRRVPHLVVRHARVCKHFYRVLAQTSLVAVELSPWAPCRLTTGLARFLVGRHQELRLVLHDSTALMTLCTVLESHETRASVVELEIGRPLLAQFSLGGCTESVPPRAPRLTATRVPAPMQPRRSRLAPRMVSRLATHMQLVGATAATQLRSRLESEAVALTGAVASRCRGLRRLRLDGVGVELAARVMKHARLCTSSSLLETGLAPHALDDGGWARSGVDWEVSASYICHEIEGVTSQQTLLAALASMVRQGMLVRADAAGRTAEGAASASQDEAVVSGKGHLDLRGNGIGPEAMGILSEHLFLAGRRQGHVCLTTLLLSDNPLRVPGALTLGKGLRCLPCLQHLQLANTCLEDAGAEALVKGLGNGHFFTHGHGAVGRRIERTGQAMRGLATALPQLRVLGLRSNGLGAQAVDAIAPLLGRLHRLDVGLNLLDDEAMAKLCQSLSAPPLASEAPLYPSGGSAEHLEHLNVLHNKFGPVGEQHLLGLCQSVGSIVSLNGCDVTGRGAASRVADQDLVMDGCLSKHALAELHVLANALRVKLPGGLRRISLRRCALCKTAEGTAAGEALLLAALRRIVQAGGAQGLVELDVRDNDLGRWPGGCEQLAQSLFEQLIRDSPTLSILNGVVLRGVCREHGDGVGAFRDSVGNARYCKDWGPLEAVLLKQSLAQRCSACKHAKDGINRPVRCSFAANVTTFVLEGNRALGPSGVAAACQALQVCENLQQLGMGGCGAGLHGAEALAASLSCWKKLTGLFFGGNFAGNVGCRMVLLGLWRRHSLGALLMHLDLSFNGIGHWKHVLPEDKVWWTWGQRGAKAVRVDESASLDEVMQGLGLGLCSLNLSGNPLGSAAVSIVDGLAQSAHVAYEVRETALLELDFSQCLIGPQVNPAVAEDYHARFCPAGELLQSGLACPSLAARDAAEDVWSVQALAQAVFRLAAERKTDIEFRQNGLGDLGARCFMPQVTGDGGSGLVGLGLAGNAMRSDGLLGFTEGLRCARARQLQRLDLRFNELGARVALALRQHLEAGGLPHLTSFNNLAIVRHRTSPCPQRHAANSLCFDSRVHYAAFEAPFMARMILHAVSLDTVGRGLTSVAVRGCQLRAEGLGSFAHALAAAGASLTALDLGRNQLGTAASEVLQTCLQRLTLLRRLSLDDNDMRAHGVAFLRKLCGLRLLTALHALDLSGNMLGTEGMMHLLPALGGGGVLSPLTHLGLENNKLGAASMAQLAKVTSSLGRLQVLALAGNRLPLGDDGGAEFDTENEEMMGTFVQGLSRHCHALRVLDLAQTSSTVPVPKTAGGCTMLHQPRLAAAVMSAGEQCRPMARRSWWDVDDMDATENCASERWGEDAAAVEDDEAPVGQSAQTAARNAAKQRLEDASKLGSGAQQWANDCLHSQDTAGRRPPAFGGDCVHSVPGPIQSSGPPARVLTLGAALWATEVLERLRLGWETMGPEERAECREEAVRVLQHLLAIKMTPCDLTGVVKQADLGRAVKRLAKRNVRQFGPAAILAAVLIGKWQAIL